MMFKDRHEKNEALDSMIRLLDMWKITLGDLTERIKENENEENKRNSIPKERN